MLDKWEKGYEVVYGKRKHRYGEPFLRKAAFLIFYRILNKLTDIKIPLDTGDFRLIDKKIKNNLLNIREKNRFVRGIISWIGYRQTYVEYDRPGRFAGETKYPFKSTKARTGWNNIFLCLSFKSCTEYRLHLNDNRINAFIICNRLIYFFPKITPPGWTSILITIIFFGGVQLFTIGIIGEYIGRIFEESKNRPIYIIDEKINFEENE